MVVVPTNSPEWISRSLDSGAQAVIVLFIPSMQSEQLNSLPQRLLRYPMLALLKPPSSASKQQNTVL